MSEPTGVVLCSDLQWPVDALGRRPLLVFEPYDASVFALEEGGRTDVTGWLTERGFAQLGEGSWTFSHEHELVLGVFDEFDTLALIDEGDDLLNYPLGALPTDWFEHLQRERVCLSLPASACNSRPQAWKGSIKPWRAEMPSARW